jgi:hypothetical protein
MKTISLISLFFINTVVLAQVTSSQNPDDFSSKQIDNIETPRFTTLTQASEWADLVAVAQVDDIEYEQVRQLNAKGYAFLNILVPYKGSSRGEPIAVFAKGFDDNVCYYPDRVNEGQRYLVFLKHVPDQEDNVYYGFKPFCQLQILLSDMGHYILRTPLDAGAPKMDLSLIEQHQFNDPHAMLDATLWTGINRQKYADEFQCKIIESEDDFNKYFHLRYTQGVPIYKVRPLLKLKYKARITSKQI